MLIFISILLGCVLLFFIALLCPVDILINTQLGVFELRYAWVLGLQFVWIDAHNTIERIVFIGPLKLSSKDEPSRRMRSLFRKSGNESLRSWRLRPDPTELFRQIQIRRFDVELDNTLPWISLWVAILEARLFKFLQLKVSLNQNGKNVLHFEGRLVPLHLIRVFLFHSRLVRY